ncbi:GAF domain-containing protein [Streptomyces sp. NP160]|uniref:GAF domain-containing sensor histidine kinase n=1 Tax=Streptomyces sp. NP160 TaxID=2586637 RepID=UPI00111A6A04|nr:ATP-binding protein [Streptomyces sp. NP160]TNM67444.1 GAF domain-containing protein [Streptomyces sp. NP160]
MRGAQPLAVGLRGWLALLVVLLVALAGAGAAALLLGDARHTAAERLDELNHTSSALVVAASDAGAAQGAQAQEAEVSDLARRLRALASTETEVRAVEREVLAAEAWIRRGPPSPPTGPAASAASDLPEAHRALVEGVAVEQARLREQQTGLRDTSLVLVGLVLAGALALTLLLAVRVRRGLVAPLAEVASVLGALTSGDHARRADAGRGPAEVRAVARWVNALADEGTRARAAAERSAELRRLASEVGRLARDPIDPQRSLAQALRVLGEGLGVDRAWVRLVGSAPGDPWDRRGRAAPVTPVATLQGSWAREGAPPVVEDVGQAAEGLPDWLQRVWEEDGHFAVADLPSLVASGSAEPATVDFAERTGATAVLVVPVGAGEAAVGALTAFTHDGPRAWTDEEVALLRSVAADLGRAVVVTQLLAGSEALVEQLRELDVRKSTFLATVSHELRTPLTSIAGYVEMLREGGAGELDAGVDRMLAVVERNTVRLRVLIEDLLALSHIEDGAPRGVHEPVAVADVVREVVDEHRGPAAASGVHLDVDVDLDAELLGALRVAGDPASLARALAGLVSNAVKFTPAGGSVLVRALREGPHCLVEVVDTGIGIPLAEQGGLFTRFFRASNATALAVPGAGLGLTIARSLVEHHGGQLVIASAPETGTTARVLLPCAATAEAVPTTA